MSILVFVIVVPNNYTPFIDPWVHVYAILAQLYCGSPPFKIVPSSYVHFLKDTCVSVAITCIVPRLFGSQFTD